MDKVAPRRQGWQRYGLALFATLALLVTTTYVNGPVSADPAPLGELGPFTQDAASGDLAGSIPEGICYAEAVTAGGGGGGSRSGIGGSGAEVTTVVRAHPTQPYLFTLGDNGYFRANQVSPFGPDGGVGAYGSGGNGGNNEAAVDPSLTSAGFDFHVGSSGAGASAFYLGDVVANELVVAAGGGGAGSGHAGVAFDGSAGQFGGDAGLPAVAGVSAGADGGPGLDLGRHSALARVAIGGGQGGQVGGPGAGGIHGTYGLLDGNPGTGTNGGNGAQNESSVDPGTDAELGQPGGSGTIDTAGGGGGGYFGGGGGAGTADNGGGGASYADPTDPLAGGGGGGGGGASYVAATTNDGLGSAFISISSAAAGNAGPIAEPGADGSDGFARITYIPCDYDLTVDKTVSPTTATAGDTVTFTVVVTNNGPDHMTLGDTVTVNDNVASQYTNAPTNIVATHTTVGADSGLDQNAVTCTGTMAALDCSQPYSSGSASGVTAGGVRGLDAGGQVTITYDVVIDAADSGDRLVEITNRAAVTDRDGADGATAVVSVPNEEVEITIEKTAGTPVNNGDGTYDITFELTVDAPTSTPTCINDGSAGSCSLLDNTNVQVTDDLAATYGASALLAASSIVDSGPCTANTGYDGVADANLLIGTDTLVPGDTCVISISVTVNVDGDDPDAAELGDYTNSATVTSDQDADTGTADASLAENPEIALTKAISAGPTNNGDGTYDLEYTIDIENTGDVELADVQVNDGLDAVFGAALISGSQTTAAPCTADTAYTGVTPNTSLLTGLDTLAIGATCQIIVSVTITVDSNNPDAASIGTEYTNTAKTGGTSPGGQGVTDADDAMTNLAENPSIDVVKEITGGPTNNGDGTYDLEYTIDVANTGDVDLLNVQVTDGLDAVFGDALITAAQSTAAPCSVEATYTGIAPDTNLLSGTDTVAVGESCQIVVSVTITVDASEPDAANIDTDYTNTANGAGTSPAGQGVADADDAITNLGESPAIEVLKSVVGDPVNNGDGTHTVEYLITVQNTGDVDLLNVQTSDGLESAWGASFQSATTSTAAPCTPNPAYTGTAAGDVNLLSGTDTIAVGEICGITVTVIVAGDNLGPVTNTAEGVGTSPAGAGVADDDPADVTLVENPAIDIVKTVGIAPTSNSDGTFDMAWELVVTNSGDVPLSGVQVTDDLAATYADAVAWSVTGTSLAAADTCTLNAAFDGTADQNLLDGTDSLIVEETCTITINVTFEPGADLGPYANNADTSGTSPAGAEVDATDVADVTVDENPAIDVVKTVLTPPVNDGTGVFTTTYQVTTTNTGDVPLSGVQVTDDLTAAYATVSSWSATAAVSDGACTDNAAFDGDADKNLLDGTDSLAVAESCTIDITVTFDPNGALGDYINAASTTGVSPGGEGVTDEDDTTQGVEENPAIDVTKEVLDPPGIVNNEDGTYEITYGVVVTNSGDVPLNDVQVTDDLTATFAAATDFVVDPAAVSVTGGACVANASFDGDADQGLLSGTDSLVVGDSCSMEFAVTVTPGATLGSYLNAVTADGTSPAGEGVTDVDDAAADFPENPEISLTKDIVDPPAVINNQDGTYTLTYRLVATNTGDVPLNDVQVEDNLSATFAAAVDWSVDATLVAAGDPCSASTTYDGSGDIGLLTGTDTMAVGDVCTIDITVTVTPGADLGPYDNTATANGTSPGGQGVSDISQDGAEPDPDADGDPSNNSDPTPAWFTEDPQISLNKAIVGGVTSNGDGSFSATYGLTVANSGNVPLYNVQVDDDLSVTFAPAASWSADAVRVVGGTCSASTTYDGATDIGTLAGTDSLAVGDTCDIEIDVTVFPGSYLGSYDNTATANGTSPGGEGVTDVSQDGADADPEGDGPGDNSDPTMFSVTEMPSIDVVKELVGDPINNGDGTYDITYAITAENTGDVDLLNVQVTDGLEAAFGAGLLSAAAFAATPCTTNPTYDGLASGDINLLAGTDTLAIGETCQIDVTITVTGTDLGPHTNTAAGSGTSPGGQGVADDDPAEATLVENPAIDIVKTVGTAPSPNNDGTFDMAWELVVTNSGDVPLSPVQVTDDLAVTYADAVTWSVTGTAADPAELCTTNAAFDGSADIDLLDGTDSLAVGETCAITIDVTVEPGADLGPYTNNADVTGASPSGQSVDDTDDEDVSLAENPAIDIVKTISQPPVNDGTGMFTTIYRLTTTNTGDVPLNNVQVTDDLAVAYAAAASWSGASALIDGACTDNAAFDGELDMNVLDGTDGLAVGESCTIDITVTFDPGGALDDYVNVAVTSGTSPAGEGVDDESSTDQAVDENPAISLTKDLIDPPAVVSNGDGTSSLSYALVVTNVGDVPLNDVQVADDLSVTYADAVAFAVTGVSVSAGACTASMTYDGATDTGTLAGSDSLAVGDTCTIEVAVTVTPGAYLGAYDNTALAAGVSPGGQGVTDVSQDGAEADPDGDGDPSNNGDPTPAFFTEVPQISLKKAIVGDPINNGDGTYSVTYGLDVVNSGNVALSDVQVDDDLSATFAAAVSWQADAVRVTAGACTASTTYDGAADPGTLAGADSMAIADTCSIEIDVTFEPGSFLGSYDNTAQAAGVSPAGEGVTDVSQDGADADPEGDGPGDNSDPTPLTVEENPEISLTKDIVDPPAVVSNADGTYSLTYALVVANIGDVPLSSVQVVDDLSVTYADATAFAVTGVSVSAGACTASTTYDGAGDAGTLAGSDSMAIGDTCTIDIAVLVTPGADLGPYDNTAQAAGVSPAGADVSDVSQDGADADPDGDGDPSNNGDPTPASFGEDPQISLTKAIVGGPVNNGDGSYSVTYGLVATNSGTVLLNDVQVVDDLSVTFAQAASFTADSVRVAAGDCTASTTYDGAADAGTLAGTDSMAVGDACTIEVDVTFEPGSFLGSYDNTATANGVSPAGEGVTDVSHDGADADPEGDGPGDNSDPTPLSVGEVPEISLTKDITDPPAVVSNADGTYTLTYRLVAANTGDVALNDVQVVDDLSTTYADAEDWEVTSTTIAEADPCSAEAAYDGEVNQNLLAGGDSMAVGDTCTIDIEVLVTPGADLGPYDNTAQAAGVSPGGEGVTDVSQDGADPDSDGDGDPSNNSDPTPSFFGEDPQISLNKAIVGDVTNNDDGTYAVTYGLDIVNSGTVLLNDVQVVDDLSVTFAQAASFTADSVRVAAGDCTASTTYDGAADSGTLAGTDSMAVGDACTIEVDVTFEPGSFLGSYDNTATANGVSPAGEGVTDVSHDGADADPEGDGPGDNSDPTPLSVGENPQISLRKNIVVDPTSNDDGTYDLTYGLIVSNTGDVPLSAVQVVDDLSTTFAAAESFSVDTVSVIAGECSASTTYDGVGDTGTLAGTDSMAVGDSCSIVIAVSVAPGGAPGPFNNNATANGVSPAGADVSDVSQDGSEIDPDQDGDPGNNSDPTSVAFGENPGIDLTKSVVGSPTMNSDGSFTVSYEMVVANTGDVPLDSVTLTDNLTAAFGERATFEVDAVTVEAPLVPNDGDDSYSSVPTAPTLFNGTTVRDLISDATTLVAGASAKVTVTVTVSGAGVGVFENQASTSGTSPGGQLLQDQSPAEITVEAIDPEITTTKDLISGPTENRDGTFRLVYEITVLNSGVIDLAGVQLVDDLDSQWDTNFTVISTESSDLTVDTSFNGKSVTRLLTGDDLLKVDESATVKLTVDVDRPTGNRLANQAQGAATDVLGLTVVRDNSQDGATGDPDNDGDPTNNNVETVALFTDRLAFVDPTPTPTSPAATPLPTATPKPIVVAATATPKPTLDEAPNDLAFTGRDSFAVGLIGASLLAAGVVFVGVSRRRRRSEF